MSTARTHVISEAVVASYIRDLDGPRRPRTER